MDSKIQSQSVNERETTSLSKKHLTVTPGIWINGKNYWLKNNEKILSEEQISLSLKERTTHSKVRLMDCFVTNHKSQPCSVKLLFMHQYSHISQEHFTFISPADHVIFHISKDIMSLVNGQCNGKKMEQMTVHPYWSINTNQVWSSMEKGLLKYQPMGKGMMVSIFSLNFTISPHETQKGKSWVIFGNNKDELLLLNKAILKTH